MAIIMMSSEMQEVIGMCDRVYVMAGGRIRQEFSRDSVSQEKILASCIA
jgi:ABC-type sugar transport system ATPase subunit